MADRRSRPSPPNRRHFASPVGRGDGKRKMFLEQLEDRRLLAVGPQIIGIQPNDGDLLAFDDPQQIRDTAPRELLFRFDENQSFDPAAIDGIQITRSNVDGQFQAAQIESDFNTGVVTLRFTARKLGAEQNGITLVVSKRDQGRAGAPEIGVVGNRIDINLNVNPGNESKAQDLVDTINNDIDASALLLAELVPDGAGDTHADTDIASPPINYSPLQLDGANDVVVEPGFVGLGQLRDPADPTSSSEIIVRFAETLPDDLYQIDIYGEGNLALRNSLNVAFQDLTDDGIDDGQTRSLQFELDLGAQIIAVVPQPVQRKDDGTLELQQARDKILVYFNDDDLDPASAQTTDFYQLIFTNDTVQNTDDVSFTPTNVSYNPDLDAAELTFAENLDELPGVGPGSFRLRIGTDEAAPLAPVELSPTDPGNSFDTAHSLDADGLETQSLIISQEIQPDYTYDIDFPGANDEPGHREINVDGELHLNGGADSNSGIETFQYNFREQIGFIPGEGGSQQPAFNLITEVQKQRAREVFEIFSGVAGVQFVETAESGIIVATGDLAAMGGNSSPGDTIGLSGATDLGPAVIMDNAEIWHDEVGRHRTGELSWFLVAMHELGHQMGLGHAYDLPSGTVMGVGGHEATIEDTEPVFPGDHDVVHLQHLHRPEGRDVDLYEFGISESGLFTAETIAERMLGQTGESNLLDTHLTLYQVRVEIDSVTGEPLRDPSSGGLIPVLDTNGTEVRDLIARNDDYFSNDSYLELELREGRYFLAVTASGNSQFDPAIEDTGFYGKSQGEYDLRLNFRPAADAAIVDLDNPVDAQRPEIIPTRIDADGDGIPGGVFNHWFRAAAPSGLEAVGEARVIYVDKSAPAGGTGTLAAPFANLKDAIGVSDTGIPLSPSNPNAARAGDILRVVGNAGVDGDIRTELDNRVYELGFNDLGATLSDGAAFHVPQGVTVMIDAGALFKMRRSWIGAGSVAGGQQQDHSAGAIQIVGAPVFVDQLGNTLPLTGPFADAEPLADLAGDSVESASVHFTSYNDESLGLDTFSFTTTPAAGDWGGIFFRRDIDNADQSRFSYQEQGIFLNSVNHADIRFGGGEVLVESVAQVVDPIEIVDGRPTISFNEISFSRDAAIAASPDSFLETNFHSPQYQTNPFTSDYTRIGPDILGNDLHDNTINGLFVRIGTPAGGELEKLAVSGRWDDKDIVHVLTENLVIDATPGGPFLETVAPSLDIVQLSPLNHPQGSLPQAEYNYRLVFVDKHGFEGVPSNATTPRDVTLGNNAMRLNQLLTASGDFVARRIYRQVDGVGPYTLIAQINQTDTEFIDLGTEIGGILTDDAQRLRPRPDARLRIDPAVIVKLDSARIDMEPGGQLIAEGRDGHEIIFTSLEDDRYGVGGTYDTTNDGISVGVAGAWGGVHTTNTSRLSVDHALFAYGGGITRIEGTFSAFNVIEIHQAEARIANSIFEFNAGGVGGQAPEHRFGRGFNRAALMFVRGAQPIIVGNTFRDNADNDDSSFMSAIDINVNSFSKDLKYDYGRSTGYADAVPGFRQNHGPLVNGNRLGNNEINGMVVRGEVITTQSIWDDTDIVHVVLDQITVPDLHTYGGLRLTSSPTQSLVVKLQGVEAGFVAQGTPLETDDRVGGAIQIVGQPKSPVVLTSLRDDSHGAGLDHQGDPQVDTNNDGTSDAVATTSTIAVNYDTATVSDEARLQIDRAASFWESILRDPVSIGFDVTFANLAGGTIGTMQSFFHTDGYTEVLNRMIDDAGSHELIVRQLPIRTELNTSENNSRDQITMTQANALALGYQQADLQTQNSTQGGGPIHGLMTFRTGLDLDPDQLYLVALHEIGHALGFTSAVGNAAAPLHTLDMFRVAPGQGINDFTNAQRIMTPGAEQVFYDGGLFDPSGIPIAGLTVGDIPLSTGANFQPSHWRDDDLINGIQLGIMDPSYEPDAQVSANDKRALDLIGWDLTVGGPPSPGDWGTVLLSQYSHDRNVDIVLESEAFNANSPGVNAQARNAQFIGSLAPNEKSGDENLRLGFEIHGFLSNASDQDVYSFNASAGSEVWLDFDRTTYALDAIVELVDANDVVLAASYNSKTEATQQSALFENSFADGTAFLTQKTPPLEGDDYWAINPRDAGFRLILPGPAETQATYHLRVRSNSAPENLHEPGAGLTSGAYQLQARLREVDELPGSTVRYADIGYASNGISVYGLPLHSPLGGETVEDEGRPGNDDTRATAQPIGNLMAVDRGTISVAGNLVRNNVFGDVDWYRFDVQPQSLQDLDSFTGWPMVFDMDYADGLGRANTELSVFSENGSLLFYSRDSNIAEDRPQPTVSDQTDDLTRGSVGAGDTYIGPVFLPAGSYFVAVSGVGDVPNQLNTNPLLRLAPSQITNNTTFTPIPFVGELFEDEVENVVPWHLGDVGMFVVREDNAFNSTQTRSEIRYNDPLTGDEEIDIGGFSHDVGDVAMRSDGVMFGYSLNDHIITAPCPQTDANAGQFLEVLDHSPNTMSGAVNVVGSSGIQTFELNAAGDDFERANDCADQGRVGFGFNIDALMFGGVEGLLNNPAVERLLAVGHRQDDGPIDNGVAIKRNILFEMNPDTGEVLHVDAAAQDIGPSTNAFMVGQILTGAQLSAVDATSSPGLIPDPDGPPSFDIQDGDLFSVNAAGAITTFEVDFGPQVTQQIDLAAGDVLRDGDFFVLDLDANDSDPATEHIFQFDTGSVIEVINPGTGNNVPDGTIVTVQSATGTVDFEFDLDATQGTIGSVIVGQYAATTSAPALAQLLANAINGQAALAVTATVFGSRVALVGEQFIQTPGAGSGILQVGDTGSNPIVQVGDGNLVEDADTITVTPNAGTPVTFEFDTNGAVGAGNIAVAFTDESGGSPDSAEEIADKLQQAIDASGTGLTAKHGGSLVSINGRGMISGTPGDGEITLNVTNTGAVNQRAITRAVLAEETDTESVTGPAVETAVDGATIGVDASAAFGRISFLGAELGDFRGVGQPTWVDQGTAGGVLAGNALVGMLAADTADDVADKVAAAINANYPENDVSATSSGDIVDVFNGQLQVEGNWISVQGNGGPGGTVTGITSLPGFVGGPNIGQVFAVSDQGGLYELELNLISDVIEVGGGITSQRWVDTSAADLSGIQFQGLTRGPDDVEDGRYRNLMFAIDTDGRLYAFDHEGVLQPIFNDGKTSVQTTLNPLNPNEGDIRGFDFSTLDESLFHLTNDNIDVNPPGLRLTADLRDELYQVPNCRTDDPARNGQATLQGEQICVSERWGDTGHGHTGGGTLLGRSMHFGEGLVTGTNGNTLPRTYDYPGGAHGTTVSSEFSLRDFSAADRPMLYFTYWLERGGNDPARVFISDNDGDWQLLSTLGNTGGGWQQERIGLESFAGVDHLRLRFDFSTGGGMNVGPNNNTGSEVRAVAGHFVRDGEFVQLDDEFFEFESGFTFVSPSAPAILSDPTGTATLPEDRQFTVIDQNGDSQTFELTDNPATVANGVEAIEIEPDDPAGEVAGKLRQALRVSPNVSFNSQNTHQNDGTTLLGFPAPHGERVNLGFASDGDGAQSVEVSPFLENLGFLEGRDGSRFDNGDTFVVGIPLLGGAAIPEASTITFTNFGPDGAVGGGDDISLTLEFDKQGNGVAAGNLAIPITNGMSQNEVATGINEAVAADTSQAKRDLELESVVLYGAPEEVALFVLTDTEATATDLNVDLFDPEPQDRQLVLVHEDMDRDEVADVLDEVMEPHFYTPTIVAEPGTAPNVDDGDTFTLSDGTRQVIFELDSGFVINMPSNGAVQIEDGETLTFSNLGPDGAVGGGDDIDVVLEFDKDGAVAGTTDITVAIADGNPQVQVALAVVNAINNDNSTDKTALDLEASQLSGGVVQVYAINGTALDIQPAGTTNITQSATNSPNVVGDNIPVRFLPSGSFSAADMAEAIATAIGGAFTVGDDGEPGEAGVDDDSNNFVDDIGELGAGGSDDEALEIDASIEAATGTAVVSPSQRRVGLTGTAAPSSEITFDAGTTPFELEVEETDVIANDIIKQHHDLLRVIGRTVAHAGPLGLDDQLQGDDPDTFASAVRLQDNRFEGFYFDDIQIGFNERGQVAVEGSTTDDCVGEFVNENGVLVCRQFSPSGGEYQLEIRRADFVIDPLAGTNDRRGQHFTIEAKDGADIFDGETFDISDGVHTVRFEFEDELAGDGVQSGNVQVIYNSEMADWEVARVVRDAINIEPVQVRLAVTAGLSDGATGDLVPDRDPEAGRPDIRTGPDGEVTSSNRVNLYGPAFVSLAPALPETVAEPNETTLTATETGITGLTSRTFVGLGQVGDNPAFTVDPGLDVDLFRVELTAGEELTIDVQAEAAVIRVFDAAGNSRPETDSGLNPQVTLTAPPLTGTSTYFVGISGNPANTYDATLGDNSVVGSIGFYRLELRFDAATAPNTDLTAFDSRGDQNQFRDQGQILIHSNRISNSLNFGIEVDGGNRTTLDGNSPHPGPSRNLEEISQDALMTGVVVANNLITRSLGGGIRFSGQNPVAGQVDPAAPTTFGRIYNNTIVGLGGDLEDGIDSTVQDVGIRVDNNASPTLLNNVVANTSAAVQVDGSSDSTVVGGMLYQGNGSNLSGTDEDFEIELTLEEPLFVQPAGSDPNYYLAPGAPATPNRAIDSSIASLEERFRFNLIKEPLGIPPSPIIAPDRDVTGQLRVDDPATEPAGGLGSNVFIDRGALDRSDFSGPVAKLIQPRDNDAGGNDLNFGTAVVTLDANAVVSSFQIRLNDGIEPADPNEGIGIADSTVTTDKVIVTSNGSLLEDSIDYSFSYNSTNDTIQLTPLSGIWIQDRIYTITLVNTDQWSLVAPHGHEIPDGTSFRVVDLSEAPTQSDFEFDRGFTIQVPQTLEIQVPVEGGGLNGIVDGEVFTVRQGTSPPVTFEFDLDGQFGQQRAVIQFSVTSSAEQIASDIRDTLASSTLNLGLNPVLLPDGRVHLGSKLDHTLDTSQTRLTQTGVAGGVADTGSFTIDDSSRLATFEFEDDDLGDGSGALVVADVLVHFTHANTHEEIAEILATTIATENLGLLPVHLGDGEVYVGGDLRHFLNTDLTELTQTGNPGVRPALSLQIPTVAGQPASLNDTETFTIQIGTSPPVTFELNNLDVDPNVTLGNIRIDYTDTSSVSEIAGNIVVAIQGAGLNMDPFHLTGTGIVTLGENPNAAYALDFSSTALVQLGNAGTSAAIALDILPLDHYDGTQVAVEVIEKINAAADLVGVEARPAGGASIVITGASNVAHNNTVVFLPDSLGVPTPRFIEEIEDLATNPLKANQLSGETKFTILLGDISTDLGDAPDGVGLPPQAGYPVLTGHDPAVHMITDTRLALGVRVDRDAEGQSVGFTVATDAGGTVLVTDGEQFSITVGNRTEIFEFELAGGVTTGTIAIAVDPATETAADVASTIRTAISNQNLGFTPQDIGGGTLLLGSNAVVDLTSATTGLATGGLLALGDDLDGDNYDITITNLSTAGLTASSSTTPAQLNVPTGGGGDLLDGDSFTISDGVTDVTFEFEDRDLANGVNFGNFSIDFGPLDTVSEVSTAIIDAMNLAVRDAGVDLNLNPIDVVGGVIELDGDDEDGVQGIDETGTVGPIGFFNAFVMTQLQVTASEFGLLDAWVDFNRDGDWEDAGEQVFASQQLQQGVNSLTVQAPLAPASKAGLTYARFRISSTGGLSPTGLAADGEVEDYEVEIVPGRPPEAKNDPTPPAQFNVNQNDLFDSLDLVNAGNDAGNLLDNDVDADGDFFQVIDVDGDLTDGVSNTVSALGADVVINTNRNDDPAADTGTFTWDPSGSASLKALIVGQIATDTFTYDLVETSAHNFTSQTSATVSLTVTGLNDQPTATSFDLDADEDGVTVSGSFVGDDDDADNDVDDLVYDIVTSATVVQVGTSNTYNLFRDLGTGSLLPSGSVTKNSIDNGDGTFTLDNTFTFDPNVDVDFQELAVCVDPGGDGTFDNLADCQTQVSFTYTATDIHTLSSAPATVTFTVSGDNDAPVAVIDDFYVVDQDEFLETFVSPSAGQVAGVLFNDSDVDNGDDPVVDHYNFSNLPQAAAGTTVLETPLGAEITLFADGTFDYDARGSELLEALADGSSETETFTYTIIDGQGVTASTTVEITVNGVNNPPLAANDGLDDSDPLNPIYFYQVGQFDVLTVSIDEGLIGGQGLDDFGEDTDPDVGDSLQVEGLIQGDGSLDTTLTTDLGGVVTLLQDANGDFLGDFSYDPTPSDDPAISLLNDLAVGTSDLDTFDYIVIDENGLTDTAEVTIEVFGVNKPPVAVDDFYTTSEDVDLLIACPEGLIYGTGLDSDVDDPITDTDCDDPLVLEVVQLNGATTLIGQSDLGAVVIVGGDGTVQYSPDEDPDQVINQALQELNAGEQVLDHFTYTISDGQGGLATADVFVTVTGLNDAPRAVDDPDITTPQGELIHIPVTVNDTDVDGVVDITTLAIVDNPATGATATANLDGTITFTPPPAANTSLEFTFTYTVQDNNGAVSLPATVTVLVNDPPVAVDDQFSAIADVQNTATSFDIVANDTDTEDGLDRSTVTIVQPNDSDKGILTLDQATGEVTYTPDPDYFAANAVDSGDGRVVIDTFRYTIGDTDGATSTSAEVTINVTEDPSPWQNKVNPFDVDGDGHVSPIDALIIITYLNEFGSGPIAPPTAENAPPPFYDTNGDNEVVPGDINRVITELNLNANASSEGEGEGEGESLEVELHRSFGQPLFVSGSLQSEPVGLAADDSSVTETSASDVVQAYDDIQRQSVAVSQGQRASGLQIADGNELEDLLDEIAGELADASGESAHAAVFGDQLDRWDS